METSCNNFHIESRCVSSNTTRLLYVVMQIHDYHARGNRIEDIISKRNRLVLL